MRITMHFPSEKRKNINRILDIILEYSRHNATFEEYIDENGIYIHTLVLRTNNKWTVNVVNETLTYHGSRSGFKAATPFRSQGYEFNVFPSNEVVIYRDEWPALYAKGRIIDYQTSYPNLKPYERIVPLQEQPDMGVVLDWDGDVLRVLPYRNTYKTEEITV